MQPYGEVAEATTADPVTGKTVVTNLRLPGQYDERLLGSVGLQGPYYNWNRWYLPSVGRYLELDPIALRGRFNARYGPDWYNYADGNPLLRTDPFGLATLYDLYGEILAFLADQVTSGIGSSIAGGICASQACKLHLKSGNFDTMNSCTTLANDPKYRILFVENIQIGYLSGQSLMECADSCSKIVSSQAYRSNCLNCQ
jgi:RHS repeat-associated protein